MADVDWTGMWMNREQLISRLAARHNVLVGFGARRLWQLRQDLRRNVGASKSVLAAGRVRMDSCPLWLVDVQRWPLHQLALALNGMRYRRQLPAKPGAFIGLIFHPAYWRDLEAARPGAIVYHVYDYFRKTPGWNARLDRDDRDLLRRADVVTASSRRLVDFLKNLSEREVMFLPNGVDYARFSQRPAHEPEDLGRVPHPRIGYTGRLNRKVDFELICQLAVLRKQWSFVMVGPVAQLDESSERWYRFCLRLPNVWFLGEKPPVALPSYVWGMDVNIMCYAPRADLWTGWGYPLKLHEYLATGRPVVSADLDSVREFTDVVRIARNPEEWSVALDEALAESGAELPAARQAVAAANSWDNRVAYLESRMAELRCS